MSTIAPYIYPCSSSNEMRQQYVENISPQMESLSIKIDEITKYICPGKSNNTLSDFMKKLPTHNILSENKFTEPQLKYAEKICKVAKNNAKITTLNYLKSQRLISQLEELSTKFSPLMDVNAPHPSKIVGNSLKKLIQGMTDEIHDDQEFLQTLINFPKMCAEIGLCMKVSEKLGILPSEVTDEDLLRFEELNKKAEGKKNPITHKHKVRYRQTKCLDLQPPISHNLSTEASVKAQCKEWTQSPPLSLDPRVKRWRTNNLAKIAEFTDRDADGNITKKYANFSQVQLEKMKDFHELTGIEKFLNKMYSFPTKTGYGMICCMRRKSESPAIGVVYFGVCENVIYHKFFVEKNIQFSPRQDIFSGPSIEPTFHGETEDALTITEWEHVGTYNVVISEDKVVTIFYPLRECSIEIYPVRSDL